MTMSEITTRLGVLLFISITIALAVWLGRRIVEAQRRHALAAAPLQNEALPTHPANRSDALVRILAFSTADCQQCHRLQAPALHRIMEARGDTVAVSEIDATTEHQLAEAYHVLTVPTTVVLDASGKAHAVNYGFASTQRLLEQIDEVLAKCAA